LGGGNFLQEILPQRQGKRIRHLPSGSNNSAITVIKTQANTLNILDETTRAMEGDERRL
jgi:hypothetical protein